MKSNTNKHQPTRLKIEVTGCVCFRDEAGWEHFEAAHCSGTSPQFWTVYLRLPNGLALAMSDHPSLHEALKAAKTFHGVSVSKPDAIYITPAGEIEPVARNFPASSKPQPDKAVMDVVLAYVVAKGWSIAHGGPAASKTFDSCVGPKEAVIWPPCAHDQVGNFTLSGEYWSEGRNILEPYGRVVNIDTPLDEIQGIVGTFLQKVEEVIKGSYAVRLLES